MRRRSTSACFLLIAGALAPAIAFGAAEKVWSPLVRGSVPAGEPQGASASARGIVVAPEAKELAAPPAPYLWNLIVRDRKIYGASGDGGEIWLLPEDGSAAKAVHDANPETQVQAIASGEYGIFAGLNPGAKILSVRGEKADVLFDASEAYVWALAPRGKWLFAGVGSPGRVYRIEPGTGAAPKVELESGDSQVRSLAFTKEGKLLAGTDGRGLVMRAEEGGGRFVLFDAPRREIPSISVAADGTIWFAAVGQEEAEALPASSPVPGVSPTATPIPAPLPTDPKKGPAGQLYRMRADGFAELVWTAPGPSILSVLARENETWVATGDPGAVYAIEADGTARKLLDPSTGQVTALVAEGADVLVATANPAKAFRLKTGRKTPAIFTGAPLDAGGFARFGRLEWEAIGSAREKVGVTTRSGNTATPDASWSAWSKPVPSRGAGIASPAGRYLQYRVTLPADGKAELTRLEAVYRVENRAPRVDWIVVEEPGITIAPKADAPPSYTLPPENKPTPVRKELPSKRGWSRGWRAARWGASDADGDDVTFDVFVRATDESVWRPLAIDLPESYTTWDATALPDGRYEIKVIARDGAVNGPAVARAGERIHGPFESDTTPPRVEKVEAGAGKVTATVTDASGVASASFSVDGGEWVLMSVDDGLADGTSERVSGLLPKLGSGEHTVVVRSLDRSGNPGSGKVTLR